MLKPDTLQAVVFNLVEKKAIKIKTNNLFTGGLD
jgi:hypothetical protein